MDDKTLNQGLLDFLRDSPTPFHATENLRRALLSAGYRELDEGMRWQIGPGECCFVTRNGSSLIALRTGDRPLAEQGLHMIGAHTDSPCLRLKPLPEKRAHGYLQLGVEVYGGALLNPWFDRDLSIAGRVSYRDTEGQARHTLVDFGRPVAVIPSLAIHLDRDANKSRSINAQNDLPPLLMQVDEADKPDFRALLAKQLRQQEDAPAVERVLDFELSLYDTQPPAVTGLQGEFIASARLDNLLSCWIGLRALLDSDPSRGALLVCNDHEEIGSTSACGADGPFLRSLLGRLLPDPQDFSCCIEHSRLVSVDNAHGIHPNFADRHDAGHGPRLNAGPVIKTNANQRYATNSETAALFRLACEDAGVPVQSFVVRSDMACGSTIGSITAGQLGVRTLDVGVASFAMHSIRELAGSRDTGHLYRALLAFLARASD